MSTRLRSIFLAVVATGHLTACVSGYKQFYSPNTSVSPERIASLRVAPPTGRPIVERSRPDSPDRILDAYAKRGYYMIGNSMFNAGRPESDDSAVQQAISVGADLVLILNPTYTGSVTSSIPVSTPTSTTAYTNVSGTAFGSGGPVSIQGTATTTTYGTQTTYVPYTIHRSDYGAVFFIKQKFSLGAFFRDLSDDERQRMQSNRGAVIRLIADDTPAFAADLLIGDVVVEIDGAPVMNSQAVSRLLAERRGKAVVFSILRDNKSIQKSVTLTP